MDYEEKREFKRIPLHAPVTFYLSDNACQTFIGESLDLSANGLLMAVDTPLHIGDIIHFTMSTKHRDLLPFEVTGAIMRIDEIVGAKHQFQISVAFIDVK